MHQLSGGKNSPTNDRKMPSETPQSASGSPPSAKSPAGVIQGFSSLFFTSMTSIFLADVQALSVSPAELCCLLCLRLASSSKIVRGSHPARRSLGRRVFRLYIYLSTYILYLSVYLRFMSTRQSEEEFLPVGFSHRSVMPATGGFAVSLEFSTLRQHLI